MESNVHLQYITRVLSDMEATISNNYFVERLDDALDDFRFTTTVIKTAGICICGITAIRIFQLIYIML